MSMLVAIAISVIAGLMVALSIGAFRRWQQGPRGKTELKGIYDRAVQQATPDRDLRRRAIAIIHDGRFLDGVLVPATISRQEEMRQFLSRLSSAPDDGDRQFVEDVFRHVLDGLQHASYPAWGQKYKDWRRELTADVQAPPQAADDRLPGYLVVTLRNDKEEAKRVVAGARAFFSQKVPPIPYYPSDALHVGNSGAETDPAVWRSLLIAACRKIHAADAEHRRLHIALGTVTLWNFALGLALSNRYGLVLYHYQQRYYRLWQIDRAIKNLRGPHGTHLPEPLLEFQWTGEDAERGAAAIVLSLGANHIAEAVDAFLQAEFPAATPRCVVTKRNQELSPERPQDWIQFAVEIADLLSRRKAAHVYLFADMPAVLALMVGDSLGPYNGTFHLMQWDRSRRTYVEVLAWPDAESAREVE